MKSFETLTEVIDFAIERENEAYTLYNDMAGKAAGTKTRDIMIGFAAEELAHRRKLENVRKNAKCLKLKARKRPVIVKDASEEIKAAPDMDFEKALRFAMQLERKAAELYLNLSDSCEDPDLNVFFKMLTEEELIHHERFKKIHADILKTRETSPPANSPPPSVDSPQDNPVNWVDLE